MESKSGPIIPMLSTESHSDTPPPRDWILVVDDEQSINAMIKSALNTADLEVVTAINAAEALQALDGHASEPLLVLTDVLMPGMDGLTLARKLLTRLTQSKIIIISGHLTDISWWPADLRELVFLAKPFRTSEISALVDVARAGLKRVR